MFAMLVGGSPARAAEDRALRVGFDDHTRWRLTADEPWWALVDLRDILTLFHPFSLPRTGGAAGASRELTLPAGFRPPFALRFFCADDYFADAEKHKPGMLGTESFFAHRLKQVLIDGRVIWERDVVDENKHGSPTIFQVDITPFVTPGQPFQLTFRAWDRLTTLERNPGDIWFRGGTWYGGGDANTEQEPRFHTTVWFADVVVGEKEAVAAAPAGMRPHEAVVRARHQARWPMPPRGEQLGFPVTLSLVAPARIPASGFPIACGIPMPPGVLTIPKRLRLTGPAGDTLPLQLKTIGVWPDGSIRWLLLETVLPAGTPPGAAFQLHRDAAPPRIARASSGRLVVTRSGQRVTIRTGALRVQLGDDPAKLLDGVTLARKKRPLMTGLTLRMTVRLAGAPTPVEARWDRTEIVARGPVTARVECHGRLTAAGQPIGRFVFRLYAYAGLPTLQTHLRIFNDLKSTPYRGTIEDAPLDVTDLALVADLPGSGQRRAILGIDGAPSWEATGGSVRLLQETADHLTLTDGSGAQERDQRGQGWIALPGPEGSVQASMWRFWQQYPKSLAADPPRLEIGLFAPSTAMPRYRPRFGEAKRHDIWFGFSDHVPGGEDQRALGLLADEAPRLFDGNWFCRSGGINVLDPAWFDHQPRLKEWVGNTYGDVSTARVTGHFGIRDFGDMPYGNQGQWLNGYWAFVQGPLNWGLASGDPRWLQRGFEIARHLADVDTVHIPLGHPDWHDWDGVTCALGPDHSVHNNGVRWPAFQQGESLILHYWMTGDPDSLAAGVANADSILRSKAGLGSSEARSQARPMLTLLRVWQATGDRRYLEGARQYLHLDYQIAHVLDWRRGAYIQPTYENWRCISAGLDSMYAHNIYEYYRLTGDPDAAQLVVAIADSVYAESMLPQEEAIGSFLFYVRYDRGSWYYTQMAMLFFMAYDLTEDRRFLRAGRAAFERYLRCVNAAGQPQYQPVHNFGWLDPEFGGWIQEFRHIPTAPFRITGQTPVPDPANYAR
jgi:hypothetical protein